MPAAPQVDVTASTQQQFWWWEAWLGARKRIITILTELMVSTALGLSLALFYVLFRIFILAGLPSEAFQFLEWLDSWAIRAVFLAFTLEFVIDAVKGTYRRATAPES